jgi:TATA-binding protein-associated factor Taf7
MEENGEDLDEKAILERIEEISFPGAKEMHVRIIYDDLEQQGDDDDDDDDDDEENGRADEGKGLVTLDPYASLLIDARPSPTFDLDLD